MTVAIPESSIVVVRKLLAPAFPDVHIGSRVLSPRPQRFVRVTRFGGPTDWAIDRASMLLEFWAPDSVQAERDALTGDRVLRASDDYYWRGNGITEFPDPDYANQSRWQLTGTLGITIH